MTVSVKLTSAWQPVSDGTRSTFIYPLQLWSNQIEVAIADSAPAAGDVGFPLDEPLNLPPGVKAWARGTGELRVSQYTISQ